MEQTTNGNMEKAKIFYEMEACKEQITVHVTSTLKQINAIKFSKTLILE